MRPTRDEFQRVLGACNRTRTYDGETIPESAGRALDNLQNEEDRNARFDWYSIANVELGRAGNTELNVKVAERMLAEFDTPTSRMTLARALLRAGRLEEAFAQADVAVEQAAAEGRFVNDAVQSAVRLAIESGERERIDLAVRKVLALFRPRRGDLRFESEWVDAARERGADPGLLDEVVRRFGGGGETRLTADNIRRLHRARRRTRTIDGERVPGSVGRALDALGGETDPNARFDWYVLAMVELDLAGRTDLTARIAEQLAAEFPALTARLIHARALLQAGRPDEAFAASDAAVEAAVAKGEYVNEAVLSGVRFAVQGGERDRIDAAVRRVLAHFDPRRRDDWRFEDEWVEPARELGADPALLDEVVQRFGR